MKITTSGVFFLATNILLGLYGLYPKWAIINLLIWGTGAAMENRYGVSDKTTTHDYITKVAGLLMFFYYVSTLSITVMNLWSKNNG